MIFKDISNFNNTRDYLPILNGCINADLFVLFFEVSESISLSVSTVLIILNSNLKRE